MPLIPLGLQCGNQMEAKTEPGELNYRWPFYPVTSKKSSPKTREGEVSGFLREISGMAGNMELH